MSFFFTRYSPLENYIAPSNGIVNVDVNLPSISLYTIYISSLKTLNTTSLYLLL
nr:MAG TPA: hypothetical protein [Bacteriophage sp.]